MILQKYIIFFIYNKDSKNFYRYRCLIIAIVNKRWTFDINMNKNILFVFA